ncbi:hypothetical protein [Sorangium sp. So ce131]|uniref:hypothetical protein n=1 Tax=Sorangium sp. So ce131 TaxID=3133282 RepID=UPI003F62A84A
MLPGNAAGALVINISSTRPGEDNALRVPPTSTSGAAGAGAGERVLVGVRDKIVIAVTG